MSAAAIRRETILLSELVGITVFAVTQPVLDVLGNAPEQFVFRGASTSDIVVLALLVAVVPPAALWLPGALARATSEDTGRAVHHAGLAVAFLVGSLQLIHPAGATGPAKVALAVAATAVAALLYRRFEAARTWTRFMSLFSLVFVGLFLFDSPTGEYAFADPPEVVQLEAETRPGARSLGDDTEPVPSAESARFPDIVMIVLDELPTSLLLDQSGGIDPVRYPALADFAGDATWYRSYTTVTSQTIKAIPAILSGQMPTGAELGVWTQQPDTLFRLLGGTYHLTVSEALTRYCPDKWCGPSPISPPPVTEDQTPPLRPSTTSSAVSREPAPTSESAPSFDRGGLGALIGDAFDVWTDQIAVDRDDEAVLSGFEEVVVGAPSTTTTSTTVTSPSATSPPATSPSATSPPATSPPATSPPATSPPPASRSSAVEAPSVDDDEVLAIEAAVADGLLTFRNNLVGELPRIESFRAALTASDDPTLYFLHIVLPHQPFIFTETGATYTGPSPGDRNRGEWDGLMDVERMSLQMQFTDGLVGGVLDQVRGAGIYDDSLVIVMADHGSSVAITTEYRHYDGTNGPDLMVTPLLVKEPGQETGAISDAPIEATDVLPTIADMLDIDVPWEMDGRSVLGRPAVGVDPGCEDVRHFIRFALGRLSDDDASDTFELCASDLVPSGLESTLGERRTDDEWATAGLARLTPHADILGAAWDELGATTSSATFSLDDGGDLRGGSSPPIGVIQGSIADPDGIDWVAVGIGGRVAGISPIYPRRDDDGADTTTNRFAIIVPSPLLSEEGYEVRVAALSSEAGELRPTELTALE